MEKGMQDSTLEPRPDLLLANCVFCPYGEVVHPYTITHNLIDKLGFGLEDNSLQRGRGVEGRLIEF